MDIEIIEEKLKDEVSNFVDLHDWDNSIEAGSLYTGFHMVNESVVIIKSQQKQIDNNNIIIGNYLKEIVSHTENAFRLDGVIDDQQQEITNSHKAVEDLMANEDLLKGQIESMKCCGNCTQMTDRGQCMQDMIHYTVKGLRRVCSYWEGRESDT
jgi:hypothetical protein